MIINEKTFPLVKAGPAISAEDVLPLADEEVPTDIREMVQWRSRLQEDPEDWVAHYYLAMLLRQRMQLDEAGRHLACAARQIADDDSQAPTIHGTLALNLLQSGNLSLGWAEYQWRLRGPLARHVAPFDQLAPRWDGHSTPRELLLFHYEQGLGDTIHFCRYLKYPIMQGARVMLFCQPPLRRLMRQSYGHYLHVIPDNQLPQATRQASLLSMPYLMQPQIGSHIPAEVPYLGADPTDVERLRRRIDSLAGGRPRLAIAWRGNPHNPTDGRRSIPPEQLGAILALDADFFVIQPDARVEELRELGHRNVHSLATDMGDFADTAAALTVLDGLISVDTSVLHLAGALDRPAWALLAWPSDWRWGMHSRLTDWYPSVRLFRRGTDPDWHNAVAQLEADLGHWLATR